MYRTNSRKPASLTEGNVRRGLLAFSLPFLLSNLVQNLYMVADMFIVQWVNGAQVSSAVGIGGEIVSFFTYLIIGLSVGGTVLISQYTGAGERAEAQRTIRTLLSLFALLSVLAILVMLALARPLLLLLRTPPEAFSDALRYMVICTFGSFFIFEYNAVSAVLTGLGDSRHPLMFVACAGCANVFLDLLFVAGFGLGTAGSALATVMSQALSLALSLRFIVRKGIVNSLSPLALFPDRGKIRLIFRIGLPTAVQNSISSVSFMFLTAFINQYGYAASAAAQLAGKFNNIAMIPSSAMSNAMAVMTGQNIGAGKQKRALECLREGIRLSLCIGVPLFLATVCFTPSIMSLLAHGEKAVIDYGVLYIRGFCIDYLLTAFVFSGNGFVTGTGHTKVTLAENLIQSTLVRVPAAFFFSDRLGLGLLGVGMAVPAATLAGGVFVFSYIRSGRWEKSKHLPGIRQEG